MTRRRVHFPTRPLFEPYGRWVLALLVVGALAEAWGRWR